MPCLLEKTKKLYLSDFFTYPFEVKHLRGIIVLAGSHTDPKKYSCVIRGLSEAKLNDLQTYGRASNNTNWYQLLKYDKDLNLLRKVDFDIGINERLKTVRLNDIKISELVRFYWW